MPQYTIKCEVFQEMGAQKLTFSEYDEVKAGTRELTCPLCGGWGSLVFDPGNVAFVLKDGESGGWISKAGKENTFRAKHNRIVAKRQRDHAPRTTLQPNFGGAMTGDWKTARDVAYESTYETVRQEHGTQIAVQAATESAKTYDPLVKRSLQ